MSMSDRDSDLLGLVANGDMTGASRLLMELHGGAVYRHCREELRDTALADDVQPQVLNVHRADCLDELHGATRTVPALRFRQGLTFEDMARRRREKPGTLHAKVR